jgi:hypothetical protein
MWTAEDDELVAHRGDGRLLYRLVDASTTTEDDWRSHYEEGQPPRKAQIASAVIHMSISCADNPDVLRGLAHRWPQLGSFIASFDVMGDLGIWYAETLWPGHYSIWGRPADLQRCVHLPAEPV